MKASDDDGKLELPLADRARRKVSDSSVLAEAMPHLAKAPRQSSPDRLRMPRTAANGLATNRLAANGLKLAPRTPQSASSSVSAAPTSVMPPLPRANRAPTFVLSGGGNLGALQVGMLHALLESGLRPGMIVGTSVGAINGAFLASRSDLHGIGEIANFWSTLRRKDVLDINLSALAGRLLGRRGYLFDSAFIRQILESFVSFRRLEDAPVPVAVVATSLDTWEPVVLRSGDATTALLASSAIPRLLPPVEIEGRLLVDGALAADVPLREAVSLGAHDLYVLPTAPSQVAAIVGGGREDDEFDRHEQPTVRVVPPPRVHIPLGDLRQSQRLVQLGYDQTRAWMEGKPLPDAREVERRRVDHTTPPGQTAEHDRGSFASHWRDREVVYRGWRPRCAVTRNAGLSDD